MYNEFVMEDIMIKSVEELVENEIVINKSRFIGIITHVSSEAEVKDYLELYREMYPDASHHCYAYIIDGKMKCSDDGEPSKTAGAPMLNVLEKQELNQVLAITIRYFGGIKLGAGGLVRAYSQSVSEALLKANIVTFEAADLYDIYFDYSFIRQIDYYIRTMNIPVSNKRYEEKVIYSIYVKNDDFFQSVQQATGNQYIKKFIRQDFIKESNS